MTNVIIPLDTHSNDLNCPDREGIMHHNGYQPYTEDNMWDMNESNQWFQRIECIHYELVPIMKFR